MLHRYNRAVDSNATVGLVEPPQKAARSRYQYIRSHEFHLTQNRVRPSHEPQPMSVPTPLLEYKREQRQRTEHSPLVTKNNILNNTENMVGAEVLCGECVTSSPIDVSLLAILLVMCVVLRASIAFIIQHVLVMNSTWSESETRMEIAAQSADFVHATFSTFMKPFPSGLSIHSVVLAAWRASQAFRWSRIICFLPAIVIG